MVGSLKVFVATLGGAPRTREGRISDAGSRIGSRELTVEI